MNWEGQSNLPRRCAAEFIGTFAIVFAPVALSAASRLPGADGGLAAASWVSGLSVLVMIYALGHLSAAHFNPAVTIAFAAAQRFPRSCVLPYLAAQFAGATGAAGVVALLLGGGHGTHAPMPGSPFAAVGMETVLTFFLMLVIMAVATDRRADAGIPGLAIGLTVVVDVWIGGAVTGGSMNPARSFGPALFAGSTAWSHYWIYAVSPVVGAVLAALTYEAIRGDERHAQGAPNDLYETMQEIGAEASRLHGG